MLKGSKISPCFPVGEPVRKPSPERLPANHNHCFQCQERKHRCPKSQTKTYITRVLLIWHFSCSFGNHCKNNEVFEHAREHGTRRNKYIQYLPIYPTVLDCGMSRPIFKYMCCKLNPSSFRLYTYVWANSTSVLLKPHVFFIDSIMLPSGNST
jgi:hypothetical protein